uniref:Uncharacterized protein n=1 Tax=Anguilla anguilla TaxID=7936 RepID=A0A0E9UPK5_ANGAN
MLTLKLYRFKPCLTVKGNSFHSCAPVCANEHCPIFVLHLRGCRFAMLDLVLWLCDSLTLENSC